ncbi:MAG: TorF family putative porin, partial [Gammaproteobacteria bacterium]
MKLTSNYVYRGYSKSRGDPVVQGSLDFEHSSGFFIGTWISQVDFDDETDEDRATIEVNSYMGWSVSLSEDWRAEAMVAGYIYDGRVYGHGADYSELFGQVHFRDLVTARVGVAYDA